MNSNLIFMRNFMTTSFILILLIIITLFAIFKWTRGVNILLIFTLISFLAIGSGVVPLMMMKNLQSPFFDLPEIKWEKSNAIVLLGAGVINLPNSKKIEPAITAHARIREAASLYFSCVKNKKKCEIISSGGDTLRIGTSEAAVYLNKLLDLGVNNSDIKLESNSMNTYQNAEFTSAILKKDKFDQVILVTSAVHLSRSLLYFSNFGIKARPSASDYLMPEISLLPTGYNFAITDFALHEYFGIARLYIYNFFGLNKNYTNSYL